MILVGSFLSLIGPILLDKVFLLAIGLIVGVFMPVLAHSVMHDFGHTDRLQYTISSFVCFAFGAMLFKLYGNLSHEIEERKLDNFSGYIHCSRGSKLQF